MLRLYNSTINAYYLAMYIGTSTIVDMVVSAKALLIDRANPPSNIVTVFEHWWWSFIKSQTRFGRRAAICYALGVYSCTKLYTRYIWTLVVWQRDFPANTPKNWKKSFKFGIPRKFISTKLLNVINCHMINSRVFYFKIFPFAGHIFSWKRHAHGYSLKTAADSRGRTCYSW